MKNKFLILSVIVCLLSMQVWCLYITFHYPYYGITLQQNSQKIWVIHSFDSGQPKLQSKLHTGDEIVKVNGDDPNNYPTLRKWGTLEQSKTVTISRSGQQMEVNMRDQTQTSFDYISLLGEIFSLCIAFLIFMKIPNSKSARFLALVFLFSGIIFMSIPASSRVDYLATFITDNLVVAYPLIFLNFLILFFKEKCGIQLPIKLFYGLYGLAAIYTLQSLSLFTPYINFNLHQLQIEFLLFTFLLGLLSNVFILIYTHFKYRKENRSVQMVIRFVGVSFLISCTPLVFLSFLPLLLYQKVLIGPVYTVWFIILFPISFIYLIVTKQLFDLQLIVRRIIYTTIIAIIPSALIVGLLALVFFNDVTLTKLMFSFLFIITIISFLLYLLEYFVIRLEVIMFPRKYQLQRALKNISKNLGTIKSFGELNDIILTDIVNSLHVYGGAIVFQYPGSYETISEGEIDLEEVEQNLRDGNLENGNYSFFEINRHEEYTSYLIMTIKKNNTALGIEEKQWLNLIISYLSVSLENVYLIRKLTMKMTELASQIPNDHAGDDFVWFRKSLFRIQEQERFRIAADIHDTTIQDLLLIRTKLITLAESEENNKPIYDIVKHLELVNESLRQNCFELNPYLLQRIGLVRTIETALDLEIGRSNFEISFLVEEAEKLEKLDNELKKHLFRMFQELMQNAKKHSKADKVTIKLAVIDQYVCIYYKDNGVGMDVETWENQDKLKSIAYSGLGLEQMKSRVLHLNGHLELKSKKGSGVNLSIRIPLLKEADE